MAGVSKHNGDVLNWLRSVIDSCTTYQQWIVAGKLVRLYSKRSNFCSDILNIRDYHKSHLRKMISEYKAKINGTE